MPCAFVAVDWGTTTLRAYAVDKEGRIMETVKVERGIQKSRDGFEQTLAQALGALPDSAGLPVLMAGMVGSRQGWVEAPYVPVPCDVAMLASQLTDVPSQLGRDVKIVPGVADFSDASPDVMRGEETQLLGVIATMGLQEGTVCMPGTHCKWVRLEGGRIVGFHTYMTGEAFKLFSEQSILARLMEPNGDDDADDWPAFEDGLARAALPGHLLNHLFSVRTDGLFERRRPQALKSFLSGILIGHELRAAEPPSDASHPVVLVGDGRLTARYQKGLEALGVPFVIAPEDIVVVGLIRIAAAAGWLAGPPA